MYCTHAVSVVSNCVAFKAFSTGNCISRNSFARSVRQFFSLSSSSRTILMVDFVSEV